MSMQKRPVHTLLTICDLCNEPLPEGEPSETGSLTAGFIAHPVTPRTKRVWFIWPPEARKRRGAWNDPSLQDRRYDFHAECILRLVESNLADRPATEDGTR